MNTNRFDSYRGFCIERLKAQVKKFKQIAEKTLNQNVTAIYAVGGVVGDGDFDDTSDVEIIFEVDNIDEIDYQTESDLQYEIESNSTAIGFIRCYVGSPESDQKHIRLC